MTSTTHDRRKPISITIPESLIQEARACGINTSQAAEEGIVAALRKIRGDEFYEHHKPAIDAYNKRIDKKGIAVKSYWMK